MLVGGMDIPDELSCGMRPLAILILWVVWMWLETSQVGSILVHL